MSSFSSAFSPSCPRFISYFFSPFSRNFSLFHPLPCSHVYFRHLLLEKFSYASSLFLSLFSLSLTIPQKEITTDEYKSF